MSVDEKKVKSLTWEEKDRLVEEMRRSGLTQQEWCDGRGIRLRTLRHWIHERNRREREEKSPQPVAWLAINEKSPTMKTEPAGALEVKIGVFTVRVSPGFDPAMFESACRTLSKLC